MIDHFSIAVNNFEQSLKFYDETLKILGYDRLKKFQIPDTDIHMACYGRAGKPTFWISTEGQGGPHETIGQAKGVHIAFQANNVDVINKWYQKCIELGGKNNGEPGPRADYHEGYYGAFIVDPNGWRIEACLHTHNAF